MASHLADTNIFIAVFKGSASLSQLIEDHEPAVNSIVYLELIQGAKDKREINRIESFLADFDLIHFDYQISLRSIDLVRRYSKSHGLMLPDAVIAATCLENDLVLITRNTKHFQYIDGMRLFADWNEAF